MKCVCENSKRERTGLQTVGMCLFESPSQYVMFIRSTPIHEFPPKGSQHQFTFVGSLRQGSESREENSVSEKAVCGWVEKCCISAHMQSVDTNICCICFPCHYSTDLTRTMLPHVLGETCEESAQLAIRHILYRDSVKKKKAN